MINDNVNNEKNYKSVIKDIKNKLFRIGNIIINKIF